MVKKSKYQKTSTQTQDESQKVALATQRPGQTKEQTKIIAQGIEKGISQYKKLQKEKARELNRKLHKASKVREVSNNELHVGKAETVYIHPRVPWLLLVVSWLGFIATLFLVL